MCNNRILGTYIAALYGLRWNVELDIRAIKQTLGLDHVQNAGHGRPGVMGDVAGIQFDPQGDRDIRGSSRQAATLSGLHLGLPNDSVVLDAVVHGVVFQLARHVYHNAGAYRRQ